jgi:putative PIN family toxin of toxin-antitoxin system
MAGIAYDTSVRTFQIVINTNVFVAALRSRRGASHKLLTLLNSEKFAINISVPLVLEYEAAAKRLSHELRLTAGDIDDILDYMCAIANRRQVFYLWRPFLKDPKDDMVLELAVTANCDVIVTYNIADLQGIECFGLRVMTPKDFLQTIEEVP